MDPADQISRLCGITLLCTGVGLTAWVWHLGSVSDLYAASAAIFGPTILALGLGQIVHGKRIPVSGATWLTRGYGLLGGCAAIVNLHLLGYFRRVHASPWLTVIEHVMPFAILLTWVLPERCFRGGVSDG